MSEAGFPGFEATNGWGGFWAPAGTPRAIVDRLHRDIAAVLALEDRLLPAAAELIGVLKKLEADNAGVCVYEGKYHILYPSSTRGAGDPNGSLAAAFMRHAASFRGNIDLVRAVDARETAVRVAPARPPAVPPAT